MWSWNALLYKVFSSFQLILGVSDEQYFDGSMVHFPVVDNDGRWMVQVKSIVFDGFTISIDSKALIDTGTA